MKQRQTIFVGLSGGVDSSVAALRLKNQGHQVIGVFIKVWHPDFMVCNWEQERLDAMRVAAHLKIPFLTCDAEQVYKNEVADYFINEYKLGYTPNPDVMCNKAVKFGAFIRFAKEKGADFIATGHYAQKINRDLHRGIDKDKDQSYFLWTLTQDQLNYSLFPVGNSPKKQIRIEAEKAGIPVAEKQDSQGICFLGHVDIPEFLSHYIDLTPGNVLDTNGNKIGTHKGAFVYTVGQRHGFQINQQNTTETPHYVIDKNIHNNTITVSKHKLTAEASKVTKLRSVMLRENISESVRYEAQFRYRQKPFVVSVRQNNPDTLEIVTNSPVSVPAAGQSCVLYKGTKCIGGGRIC